MTKNPFINALAGLLYITIVVNVMNYASGAHPKDDTVFAPIAFLSLFSLSAATMGYLILGWPVQLYLDGEKKEGMTLFLQTLAILAGLTIIVMIIFLSRVRV